MRVSSRPGAAGAGHGGGGGRGGGGGVHENAFGDLDRATPIEPSAADGRLRRASFVRDDSNGDDA
jgi:hypothetical protein